MGSIITRQQSRPGPIRERWITAEHCKVLCHHHTYTGKWGHIRPILKPKLRPKPKPDFFQSNPAPAPPRRTVSARAVSSKADERMTIVIGGQTEVAAEVELPSSVLVPGHQLAPEKIVFGAAAPLPEELITVADGADDSAAMSDYNLDEDDCEFLEKERATRYKNISQVLDLKSDLRRILSKGDQFNSSNE